VIGVVAGEHDREAEMLACEWRDTVVVRPRDLSCAGWSVGLTAGTDRFVAEGAVHPCCELDAVLVRTPFVEASELPHVHETDREYAAAEMTAFLAHWLQGLPVPVVNPPTPSYLLGPVSPQLEWLETAARVGLPSADGCHAGGVDWVTVVAGRAFESSAAAVASAAMALFQSTGLALFGLALEAAGSPEPRRLVGVSLRPSLRDRGARDALRALLFA
jgi:hypothetical protein